MDTPVAPVEEKTTSPNVIRRLYDWVLSWAETPYGVPALFILAFAESSFFPIPPDVLLLALALSIPTRAFRFAAWCTAGSVLGGVLGYFIGWGLWGALDDFMFAYVIKSETFEYVQQIYRDYGIAFVFVAAFTPIPYKVFTICAGVAEMNLLAFAATSLVGRGARFALVAWFVKMWGAQAKKFIDERFNLVALVGGTLLIGGVVALKLL